MKKITTASKNQLVLRMIGCVYPILYVLGWPLLYGELPAYSNYYIFGGIYFTLATSLMAWSMWMHSDIKWSVPAYALVGIALFNCAKLTLQAAFNLHINSLYSFYILIYFIYA